MSIVYTIANMRFVRPSRKVAEKNPDRWGTVYGTFYDAEGNKLSIGSKNIDREDALHPEFDISVAGGLLVMPEGKRGRRAVASLTDEDIAAQLEALRNPNPEPTVEPNPEPTETPAPTTKRTK